MNHSSRQFIARDKRAILVAFALVLLVSACANSMTVKRVPANESAEDTATLAVSAAMTRARVNDLKLITYYPTDNAQTKMWTNWNAQIIDADLQRVASLHANAVRIAIFPATFGYPNPSTVMLEHLAEFIRLADTHGLKVYLTLFGFWTRYDDIAGSQEWVDTLLAHYRDDPRLAAIELQNELDTHNPRALAWANQMLPFVHAIVGEIPLTLSVSGTDGIEGLLRQKAAGLTLDFYTLHYYGNPALAYRTFQKAKQVIGDKTLFIGEIGYATTGESQRRNSPYTSAWWEMYQDQYLRTVEYAARLTNLPQAALWILSDFPSHAFPTNRTAANASRYHYGLFRADRSPKPAAESIKQIFSEGAPDISFNNSFEIDDGAQRPTNWLLWQAEYATFARDTRVAHSGQASARISHSSISNIGLPAFYLSPVVSIVAGRIYTATVWARGENATGTTHLALAWFDENQKYLATISSPDLPKGTTAWTLQSLRANAPPNAALVEIHLVSVNNSGDAWFDDVTFDQE